MATKTKEEKTYRPEQIAEALGISGKQVRAFLRANFTRPTEAKGSSWVLTADQAKATLAHFKSRPAKDEAEVEA